MKTAAAPNSGARKIILVVAIVVTVCLLSLIVAGFTSLISLADRIHPIAGAIVFWSVCFAAGFFSLYCIVAYAKLPNALVPRKKIQARSTTHIYRLSAPDSQQILERRASLSPQL